MNRTLSALATVTVGAAALVGAAAVVAPAANAADQILPTGTYQPAYTANIFDWNASTKQLKLLTFDEWREEGYPTPIVPNESTFYDKYAWSPGITGTTFFYAPESPSSENPPIFYADGLDSAEWNRAGNPTPEIADFLIPGTDVISYRSSPELFTIDGGLNVHKLTFDEWNYIGQPPATSVGEVDKYSFTPTLYLYLDGTDGTPATVVALTSKTWNALANPTPYTAPGRLQGDVVFKFDDSPDIYLRDPVGNVMYLTAGEWNALGSPAPTVVPTGTNPDSIPSATPHAKGGATSAAQKQAVKDVRTKVGLR